MFGPPVAAHVSVKTRKQIDSSGLLLQGAKKYSQAPLAIWYDWFHHENFMVIMFVTITYIWHASTSNAQLTTFPVLNTTFAVVQRCILAVPISYTQVYQQVTNCQGMHEEG